MMAGSSPTIPQETMRASGASPSASAWLADLITTAAAPSTTPEALLWTKDSGPKAVGRPERDSIVVPRTTWSSSLWVKTVSPRRDLMRLQRFPARRHRCQWTPLFVRVKGPQRHRFPTSDALSSAQFVRRLSHEQTAGHVLQVGHHVVLDFGRATEFPPVTSTAEDVWA